MSCPTCKSYITQGREGQLGSWCTSCGTKVYEIDPRTCGGCQAFKQDSEFTIGGICKTHLMRVVATMRVNYAIEKGSCFIPHQQE